MFSRDFKVTEIYKVFPKNSENWNPTFLLFCRHFAVSWFCGGWTLWALFLNPEELQNWPESIHKKFLPSVMWPGFLLCSQAQHWVRSLIARALVLLVSLRFPTERNWIFGHEHHIWCSNLKRRYSGMCSV